MQDHDEQLQLLTDLQQQALGLRALATNLEPLAERWARDGSPERTIYSKDPAERERVEEKRRVWTCLAEHTFTATAEMRALAEQVDDVLSRARTVLRREDHEAVAALERLVAPTE